MASIEDAFYGIEVLKFEDSYKTKKSEEYLKIFIQFAKKEIVSYIVFRR